MTVKIDPITGDVTLDKTLAADLREYVVRTTQYGGPLEPLVAALVSRSPFELTLNGDRDTRRADVKVARVKEPLKYALGDEVRTEDDYANAPVGTTVRKANLTDHAGYTKLSNGLWQDNTPGWETTRLSAGDMARHARIVVVPQPKAVAVGDRVGDTEALDALPVGSRVGYGAGNRNATYGYEKQPDGSWLDYRNNTFSTSSKGLGDTTRVVFRVGPAQPPLAVGDYAQSVADYDSLPTGATVWANFSSRSSYWTKLSNGLWRGGPYSDTRALGGRLVSNKREVRSLPAPEPAPGTVGYGCRTAAELDALPVGTTLWFSSCSTSLFFTKKANNQFDGGNGWTASNNWLLTRDDAPVKGRIIRSLPAPEPKVGDLFVRGLPVGSVVSYDNGIRWVKGADGLWRDEQYLTEDGVADSALASRRTIRRIGPAVARTFAVGGTVSSAEDYAALPVGASVWYDDCRGEGFQPGMYWEKVAADQWEARADGWSKTDRKMVRKGVRYIRSLPRTFKVGDELVTEADHDAAPAGTVVAYSNQGLPWRKDTDGRWRSEGARPLSGSGTAASLMATPFDRHHRRIVSLP